ncbi:MAG: T9SS type A sorting domain-containing protein [Bacteroidia bacterium]|nr:T9SS type A sorting domain-containing protein [Bacteroidia bacterium]
MKKLLLSIMAVAALTVAEAKKVKFQVDMTGVAVSSNGLHVAGNFQAAAGFPDGPDNGTDANWEPGTAALSNGGSGNIYSLVVDIPAGRYYEFKFINDNNWGPGEEQVPNISKVESNANGGQNGNRWFYVDSLANDTMELPAVLFSGSAPAGKFAVRFAVDLKNETVATDGVFIAGAFTNWGAGQRKMTNLFNNNKVYEYIAILDGGSYQYKFKNGDNGWESVPGGCEVSTNREVNVTANATVPVVCIGSCTACPTAPIPTYNVTFRVDMTNTTCDGGYDSVTVAGAKIFKKFLVGADSVQRNWGDGAYTLSDANSDKVFEITLPIDSGECEHKFRFHKNGITSWEGIANRKPQISSDTALTVYCFNTTAACVPLPAPSNITFKVDMTNETPGVVFVMGTYQTPNWQAGAIRMQPAPGEPGVFIATVNNVCPGSFSYKFVNAADGDSSKQQWEENFPDTLSRGCLEGNGIGGFNRRYTRTSDSAVTLYYVYNSCTVGGIVGLAKVSLSNTYKLYPNPAQSFTVIAFNDNAASHTAVLMDITGRVIQSFENITANELTIPTAGLNQGIYFIKATNTRNESVTSKLIVR